jgi:isoleucyl-tRNA synthetase
LAILKGKADFKKLGPRLGAKVKKAAQVIAAMNEESLEKLAWGEKVSVTVDGQSVELESSDVVIDRIPREGLVVASEGALVVALETALTEDLIQEGAAREIVNRLQNKRKNDGLDVEQRIQREYFTDEYIRKVEEKHRSTIDAETLCQNSRGLASKPADMTGWEEMDINGHPYLVRIVPEARAGGR